MLLQLFERSWSPSVSSACHTYMAEDAALQRDINHECPRLPVQQLPLIAADAHSACSQAVLGYVVYQTNSVVCHIQKLAVHPQSRRQGVAGTLLLVRA